MNNHSYICLFNQALAQLIPPFKQNHLLMKAVSSVMTDYSGSFFLPQLLLTCVECLRYTLGKWNEHHLRSTLELYQLRSSKRFCRLLEVMGKDTN